MASIGDKVVLVGTIRAVDGDNTLIIVGANGNHVMRVETDDIKTVDAYAPAENGFVDRDDSTMAFDDGTREFSITPVAGAYDFFVQSERFTKSAELTITITDVEGLHYVYFNETGALAVTTTFSTDLISLYAFCATIYWDATNGEAVLFGDERHGNVMDSQTHSFEHNTYGARYDEGLGLANMDVDGSGADASAAQFSFDDGVIWDEDVKHTIADGSPQELSTIAEVPILYRDGAAGDWRKIAATTYPVSTTGTGLAAWNEWTGATWRITEASSNDYVLVHYFATTDVNEPVVGVMGTATYATLKAAREGALNEIATPLSGISSLTPEWVAIATVIWETKTTHTNAVKSRVRSTEAGENYVDWRTTLRGGAVTNGTTWGGIGGTLSDQSDLQTALDDKASLSETGTQSFNGLIQFLGSAAPKSNTAAAAVDELLRLNEFDAGQLAQNVYLLGLLAGYQPLDSDLTAIAAIATQAVGRSLLGAADKAAIAAITKSPYIIGQEEEGSQVGASSTAWHELFSFTIPGNSLGAKGRAMIDFEIEHHGETGNSKHQWKLNGTVVYGPWTGGQPTVDSNVRYILGEAYVANNNNTGQQRGGERIMISNEGATQAGVGGHWYGDGRGSGHFDDGTEDTRSDMTISLEVAFASSDALNYFKLISACCLLHPSL